MSTSATPRNGKYLDLPSCRDRGLTDYEFRYVNTNNFLRSVRNFKIDVRNTDPYAYICGIHWQVSNAGWPGFWGVSADCLFYAKVAQGTSLENIEFYMKYNSDVPGNTQQVCDSLNPIPLAAEPS